MVQAIRRNNVPRRAVLQGLACVPAGLAVSSAAQAADHNAVAPAQPETSRPADVTTTPPRQWGRVRLRPIRRTRM